MTPNVIKNIIKNGPRKKTYKKQNHVVRVRTKAKKIINQMLKLSTICKTRALSLLWKDLLTFLGCIKVFSSSAALFLYFIESTVLGGV